MLITFIKVSTMTITSIKVPTMYITSIKVPNMHITSIKVASKHHVCIEPTQLPRHQTTWVNHRFGQTWEQFYQINFTSAGIETYTSAWSGWRFDHMT